MVDTYGEKIKAIQLHILQTQWPICKADAHILPLPNKLENNTLGNALLKVGRHTSCGGCRSKGPDTCKTLTEFNTKALFTHCITGQQ